MENIYHSTDRKALIIRKFARFPQLYIAFCQLDQIAHRQQVQIVSLSL